MSGRRKRPERLLEDDVASFVADAAAMRETVLSYQGKVRVRSDRYNALWKLHDAILTALREITGGRAAISQDDARFQWRTGQVAEGS